MKPEAPTSLNRALALFGGLKAAGLSAIVTSPGSRNAPLVQAAVSSGLHCVVALDEGAASHHAMGMSLASGRPVAVCCTSGTAALHHGPALAEAYRVGIPLISLTADRPAGAHDQWQSQTLVQDGIHALNGGAHFTWPEWAAEDRRLMEDIDAALCAGPVHINCPFAEPLYPASISTAEPALPRESAAQPVQAAILPGWFRDRLSEAVLRQERILVLGGTQPRRLAGDVLAAWGSRAMLVGDTTSGLGAGKARFIAACDRWWGAWQATGRPWSAVKPDLIISFGAPLVSRRLREALGEGAPEHIHIDPSGRAPSVFGQPARNLATHVPDALMAGATTVGVEPDELSPALQTWHQAWWNLEDRVRRVHGTAMQATPWSDLQAHRLLHGALPEGWDLHLGNSTPVRYAQLFTDSACRHPWSNRGVAGIDGCNSTAVGAALAGRPTTLITGELGFLYDANAFHVHPLPDALRIAVVHNGGGGIFRWLDGPQHTGLLQSHFEWRHDLELRPLCDLHGLIHHRVESEAQLRAVLKDWWTPAESPKVLEIVTDGPISADAHRAYMETVRG